MRFAWVKKGPVIPVLLAVLLTGGMTGTVLASDFPPIPDYKNEYEPAGAQRVSPCPAVVQVVFEKADGSTRSDPLYPLVAWFLESGENRDRPFFVALHDSKAQRDSFRAFWVDYDRDGEPDEYGDLKRLRELYPSANVCDVSQGVK